MKRINATFSDEMFKKLESYKTIAGLATFAECVHQLVALGLQKEKANILTTNDVSLPPQSTPSISPELTELLAIKKMLMNHSSWVMESRLLNRYLVAHMPNQPKEMGLKILQHFKTRVGDFIRKNPHPTVYQESHISPEKLIQMEKTI